MGVLYKMSTFVESLKRLYNKGAIDIKKLNKMVADKKITKSEFYYITKE